MGKSKNKKVKNELVFDNKKREEFLTGFSKRKKIRQKKAQAELEQKLKEEKKRINEQSKDLKEKYKQSFKPIDDLKNIVSDEDDLIELIGTDDIDNVTIKISQPKELNKFIGLRKCENSDSEIVTSNENENFGSIIKGMEFEEKLTDSSIKQSKEKETNMKEITSGKDLKKIIKKQTKSALKKSKVIQMKNNINHKRNVKLSNRKKHFKEKFLKKHKKIPKHGGRQF